LYTSQTVSKLQRYAFQFNTSSLEAKPLRNCAAERPPVKGHQRADGGRRIAAARRGARRAGCQVEKDLVHPGRVVSRSLGCGARRGRAWRGRRRAHSTATSHLYSASIDLVWRNAIFLVPSFPVSDLALPAAVGRVPATTAGLKVRSGHAALRAHEGYAAHKAHPQPLRTRRVKHVAARQGSRRG
jgi:hypothetical protein